MGPLIAQTRSIRFQGWEIRPIERLLLVRGAPVPIGGRAFDLLLVLVAQAGKVVSKNTLLDAAWPGLVVEENNVSVQIAALRKLLGQGVITTMAAQGYRLSALPESEPARPETDTRAVAPDAAGDLIGRSADIAALVEQLRTTRLVSIVGTGGVGKTAVAKAVLARHAASGDEDHHWIDLAPLRDGHPLAPLVAKALGIELDGLIEPSDTVMAALAPVRALIVLDNCEHVLSEIAWFVGKALAGAGAVHWLTTSQEPVRVAGERIYRLGPLDVPAPDSTLADAADCGAVALLCRRVLAADRRFVLHASNLTTAIDLCRRLDGLPLAIEMAAARVATLGLENVHGQLDQRLRLLAGPRDGPARQHTLRSTFDWSYGLLAPTEQKVFRRLQPFIDGFSASMAHQVARDPDDTPSEANEWQTIEVLGALVDKSLVQRDASSPGRFLLYESARDYASKCLADAGETEMIRRRHAHVVAAWFDRSGADLERLRDDQWIARYVPERHNARAALVWACEAREPDVLAALVAALARMDSVAHMPAEIVWLELPLDVLAAALPSLRAPACLELGWAHYADGNRELGTELSARALDDFNAMGDAAGSYRALAQLIRLYESRPHMLEDAQRAMALFERIDDRGIPLRTRLTCAIWAGLQYGSAQTLARLRELDDLAQRAGYDALAAICRAHITDELLIDGRFDEAIDTAERFLRAGEARPRVKALILSNEALALVQLGRIGEAVTPAKAALRAFPSVTHVVVATFALAAAREGRMADAAMMFGYADQVRRARDESPDPAEATAVAETSARVIAALGERRFTELAQAANSMSASEVLALAFDATALAD